MKPPKKCILILGGGFGGVYAALRLEKLLATKLATREADITLVSRDNFFLFTPMLHEVAASDLEITNIVSPLRKLLKRTLVVVGQAIRVDLPNQSVSIQRGHKNQRDELRYDHLVLGLGSHTNYFNLPGLKEFSLAMKTLPDAVQLRAQVIQHLEAAQHAMREGDLVAHNITAVLWGRSLKPFCFRTIGLLASIGRRTGVARILGCNVSGFFAWWLWRTIYLSKLPGLDKKVRVALEWTLDLVFHKDLCAVNDQQRRSLQNSEVSEATNSTNGEAQPTPKDETNEKDLARENAIPLQACRRK